MYEGIGHVGAVRDERFPRDVLDFVRQRPTARPEGEAERPAIADRPAAASGQPAAPQAAASGAG